MSVAGYRHAKMLQDAIKAGVTLEDLARASASDKGGQAAVEAFDADQARGELTTGTFVEHVVPIERLMMVGTGLLCDPGAMITQLRASRRAAARPPPVRNGPGRRCRDQRPEAERQAQRGWAGTGHASGKGGQGARDKKRWLARL